MRISKIDRSWVGKMRRAFEAERTACAEFWGPEKYMYLGNKFSVAGPEVYGEKFTGLGSGKLCTLYGLQRTSRNL